MQIGRVVGLRCISRSLQICLGPQSSSGALLMSLGIDARRRPHCSNIIVCSSKTFNAGLEPRKFIFETVPVSVYKIHPKKSGIAIPISCVFDFVKRSRRRTTVAVSLFWGCLRRKHSIYTGKGDAVTFWVHVLHA